jgi:hypothetical protein
VCFEQKVKEFNAAARLFNDGSTEDRKPGILGWSIVADPMIAKLDISKLWCISYEIEVKLRKIR